MQIFQGPCIHVHVYFLVSAQTVSPVCSVMIMFDLFLMHRFVKVFYYSLIKSFMRDFHEIVNLSRKSNIRWWRDKSEVWQMSDTWHMKFLILSLRRIYASFILGFHHLILNLYDSFLFSMMNTSRWWKMDE